MNESVRWVMDVVFESGYFELARVVMISGASAWTILLFLLFLIRLFRMKDVSFLFFGSVAFPIYS